MHQFNTHMLIWLEMMKLTLYDVYLVDGCLWLILFHFNIKLLIFWVLKIDLHSNQTPKAIFMF